MTFDEVVSKYELTQEEIESLREYEHLEFVDSDYFIDLEDAIYEDTKIRIRDFEEDSLPAFTFIEINKVGIEHFVDEIARNAWQPVLDIGLDTIYVEKV